MYAFTGGLKRFQPEGHYQNRQNDQRIEHENGFLRRDQRAEEADVEGRLPGIFRGQE